MPYLLFFAIQAIVMGIVEGVTEFLPISSTGHLIVAGNLIDFPKDFGKTFEIVIQLGAILAVIYYYRRKIWTSVESLKAEGSRGWGFKLWANILVAFLPAAIIGLLFDDYIEEHFFSVKVVGWAMIVGAILLFVAPRIFRKVTMEKLEDITPARALVIGVAQCLSLIPGMSRSASTIIGGIAAGYPVKTAAEFSFFLAIPIMFAASGYKLLKGFSGLGFNELIALTVGFVVSFVVALVVVEKFLDYLGKKSLDVFVYYRLLFGVALILFLK